MPYASHVVGYVIGRVGLAHIIRPSDLSIYKRPLPRSLHPTSGGHYCRSPREVFNTVIVLSRRDYIRIMCNAIVCAAGIENRIYCFAHIIYRVPILVFNVNYYYYWSASLHYILRVGVIIIRCTSTVVHAQYNSPVTVYKHNIKHASCAAAATFSDV